MDIRKLFEIEAGLGEGAERPILDFKGSQISKDRTSQKVIQDVVDLLSESEAPDALRAHNLKRQLDTMIDFRKKSKDGLTDAGRDVAKAVRHELNQAIRTVDSDYAQANDTLHKALTAFDDYENAMGSRFTIGDINASPKAGLQLRKIVSKYASSEDIKQAVRQMDDLAAEMGGSFDDSIPALVNYEKMLIEQFGDSRRGSFNGSQEAAFKQALKGKEGWKDAAIDKVAEGADKMRKINDAEAFRIMEQLHKRSITPKLSKLSQ